MPHEPIPHVLFDMHCHLDFAERAHTLATQAAPLGIRAFSATVTPAGYEEARLALAEFPSVRVGLGLHPWWMADGRCGDADIVRFEQLASSTRWIGEIGLDFAGDRGEEKAQQRQAEALDRALAACDAGQGSPYASKLISLHAVRAASEVLDALARHDTPTRHHCVFHWFSGTSDELTRAVRAGCAFSVNARMLTTKRGRAYARAIPEDRLLLETDLPAREGDAWSAQAWRAQLEETLALLADARGADPARLAEKLAQTSARMLKTASSLVT